MANGFEQIRKGVNVEPKTGSTVTTKGDIAYNSSSDKLEYYNGAADSLVSEAKAATLTNKSIDAGTNTLTNIANASISAGAAIAYSKLNLSGSIVNADINAAAAIAYSKLSLSGSIVNADVNAAAAIAYSKLNLSGSIVNADINAAAAIAYSKLNLSTSIVNADIAVGAAIARSKLAAGSINQVVINDGSGVLSSEAQLAGSRGGTGASNAGTLTFGANPLTLTTSASTNVTLPTSGTLATLAGAESLSNKTFSDAPTFTQIVTPATPSAGTEKLYPKSDGNFYTLDSSGAERKVGTGSGTINYILNPDAEGSTTGWASYNDGASNIPVDGTGGTATGLTFARTTSTPLRGTGSFLITQANSTSLQGKGVSYDFTTDVADQAKQLTVSLDYNADTNFTAADSSTTPKQDGTTSTNAGNSDIQVYIYDKTNSVLIPVTPFTIKNKNANASFIGTFQAAANSTSYRLILHCATTSAPATGYNFKFDNVSVGPNAATISASSTAARYSTSAGQSITNNTITIINYDTKTYDTNSLVTTGASWKFTAPASGKYRVSAAIRWTSSATNGYSNNFYLYKNGSQYSLLNYDGKDTTLSLADSQGGSDTLDLIAGDFIDIRAQTDGGTRSLTSTASENYVSVELISAVPNAAETSLIAARYGAAASTNLTSGVDTIINFDSKNFDTQGAVTTGASWKFTAPASGKYHVSSRVKVGGSGWSSPSSGYLVIYKNGSADTFGPSPLNNGSNAPTAFLVFNTLDLVAGDFIDIRAQVPVSGQVAGGTTNESYISIDRINSPVATGSSSSSKIAISVTMSTGQNIPSATDTVVKYDTVYVDATTSGAYSTTTGLFTAPRAMNLHVGTYIDLVSGSVTAGSTHILRVNKNGSQQLVIGRASGSTSMTLLCASGSGVVPLAAGDTCSISVFQSTGITQLTGSGTETNAFFIEL